MSSRMEPGSAAQEVSGNLLIVDDSTDDIALLADYFRDTGLRLAVALDGREGYQKAMVLMPDMILMDVSMPRTDGYAACRLLKADPRTRDIPVIFLSGSNELSDRLQGLRLGAVDYISKPFSPEEVLTRVNIHLDMYRRLRRAGEPPAPTNDSDVPAVNSAVTVAMDLLRKDIGRAPTLTELSRQAGTNERRLTELFRQATGMPVFAWLREERFQVASRLLVDTDMDIQKIADHVGYGSASNFTTMFRERLGVTPRDFRQARRERST